MNWNDLTRAWQAQTLPAIDASALATLEKEFVQRRTKLARQLFWRDLREAAAGVLVAGVFAGVGWHMGAGGWPIGLAVLLMLGLSAFFVRERLRARRAEPPPEASLLGRLEAEIAEVRRQCELLRSVVRWYLAPCLAAAVIVMVTVLTHAPVPLRAQIIATVMMSVLCAAVSWAVVVLNRRAVTHGLEPKLHELEGLRHQLLNHHESSDSH